ncbi:hypothetical protein GQ53DRAFT_757273 [Thozetella sp. PMI_491]|nr:hypothetical protein GQ53DRAFT_757273 [Thozetella sp. PMI_491]
MEAQLQHISKTLEEFIILQSDLVTQHKEKHIDNLSKACLQKLYMVNPRDNMGRIVNDKEKLFDDVYKWILEDEKYTSFINWDESNPLYQLLMLKEVQRAYFVVDALDECKEGLEDLINLISDSLRLSNKVGLLTRLKNLNREHPGIVQKLDELDVQSQKERTEKYIQHKIRGLEDPITSKYPETYNKDILKKVGDEADYLREIPKC